MVLVTAELVGAVAASAAAGLSAATLWLTSRWQERTWRRDALVEVISGFMDASFRSVGNRAFEARRAGSNLELIKAELDEIHVQFLNNLTKLRLLASREVINAAVDLHKLEDKAIDVVFKDSVLMSASDWNELEKQRMAARTAVYNACRESLRLGPGTEIEPFITTPKTGREGDAD
jgi:hypothetical protein